ncbi:P1 family peptidase [Paludibaculum fermentans]|uniref:DmpA family aminopeptidase n=1 Tax=Paludibaculum fermentans TaxID=1473598 RepID=UPI003EC0D228
MMRILVAACCVGAVLAQSPKPRAREAGIVTGRLPVGRWNAITDVPGVRVGYSTLVRGGNIRTGVTAIVPHSGNLFLEKVPAAIFVGNGFGKLMGSTQVEELGELETPVLLTGTLNVPRVADALLEYMLALPGNEQVRSINAVVGETNDGYLNDIRGRHVGKDEVFAALRSAHDGAVEEGAVGAGAGTVAFGYKGGIGTSSRLAGRYTVGVLVQSNYGGDLMIAGIPVGRELQRTGQGSKDGSCMIVIATDAPVDARNLKRMAARAMLGMGRTGSSGSNGSGDYAIAFSTHRGGQTLLANDAMTPLFEGVIEATEEAINNSLFKAETVTSNGHTVEALPVEQVLEILRAHKVLNK